MKRFALTILVLLASVSLSFAQAPCAKIQSGSITDSNGNVITTGYDAWGYNYQAHLFNGLTENYTRPATPVSDGPENLVMKWSDDWLANVDCNGDGKLDRGLDRTTGVATGTSLGWVTNHFEGDYLGDDGEMHHYTYFTKIVYVGAPATPDPWDAVRIWNVYAIIEEVYNDPYGGFHGNDHSKLAHPAGLGYY